jgi:hypothetical protein
MREDGGWEAAVVGGVDRSLQMVCREKILRRTKDRLTKHVQHGPA